MIKLIKCKLGIHKWTYYISTVSLDNSEGISFQAERAFRMCKNCLRKEIHRYAVFEKAWKKCDHLYTVEEKRELLLRKLLKEK